MKIIGNAINGFHKHMDGLEYALDRGDLIHASYHAFELCWRPVALASITYLLSVVAQCVFYVITHPNL